MAFFGLTQLGAQSTFNVNLVSLQNYTCFAEQDFRAAFTKQSGGGAAVSLDKVGPMLEEVFGGFAPEQEMEALLAALQHFEGDITFDHVMTSVAAVAGARALPPGRNRRRACPGLAPRSQPPPDRNRRLLLRARRAERLSPPARRAAACGGCADRGASPRGVVIGGKAATAQGYTSFEDWKLDLHRHTRIGYDPKDAWVEPLTEAQSYGWTQPTAEWATKRWPKVSSAETRCEPLLPACGGVPAVARRGPAAQATARMLAFMPARTDVGLCVDFCFDPCRYADSMVRQGEDYLS